MNKPSYAYYPQVDGFVIYQDIKKAIWSRGGILSKTFEIDFDTIDKLYEMIHHCIRCPNCNTLLYTTETKCLCYNCGKYMQKEYRDGMPPFDWDFNHDKRLNEE